MITVTKGSGRSKLLLVSGLWLGAQSALLSGCAAPLPEWMPDPLRAPLVKLFGFSDPRVVAKKPLTSDEVDSQLPPPSMGVNLTILQEMFRVVFLRETSGPAEYGALLNTLSQGASFEGVYNGLLANSEYRKLESEAKRVSPLTIRLFAEELTYLQMELPRSERTPIVPSLAQPVQSMEFPTGEDTPVAGASPSETPAISPYPSPSQSMDPREEAVLIRDRIESVFMESNLFTMKRVLCAEVFKVFAAKRQSRPDLARWYGAWASLVAGRGVDFQYEQRNSTDAQSYDDWAFSATTDRIQWEVLYRLHRMMNVSEGRK